MIKLDRREGPTWNYFHHSNTFMGTTYSDDCDTTSYAMCTLDDIPAHEKQAAMDVILDNLSPDNLPLVRSIWSLLFLVHVFFLTHGGLHSAGSTRTALASATASLPTPSASSASKAKATNLHRLTSSSAACCGPRPMSSEAATMKTLTTCLTSSATCARGGLRIRHCRRCASY